MVLAQRKTSVKVTLQSTKRQLQLWTAQTPPREPFNVSNKQLPWRYTVVQIPNSHVLVSANPNHCLLPCSDPFSFHRTGIQIIRLGRIVNSRYQSTTETQFWTAISFVLFNISIHSLWLSSSSHSLNLFSSHFFINHLVLLHRLHGCICFCFNWLFPYFSLYSYALLSTLC